MQTITYENTRLDYTRQAIATTFMTKVYAWMGFALLLTALAAYAIAGSEAAMKFIFGNSFVFYGVIIAEFGLVIAISAAINRISAQIASLLFVVYSLLTGVTISSIFMIYTGDSIASTFAVTSLTFGAMSLYGYVTKRDLSKLGNILIMALIGLIIASVVNIFWANSTLYWITTYAGVLIFVGLTAYDTQKIKNMSTKIDNVETASKFAILGALSLYLDFINMFLYLLRIFGRRK